MMTASNVTALLDMVALAEIRVWVDGGWGVDALLGEQTRDHDDLDLVVLRADLDDLLGMLTESRFTVERDLLPTAIALRHRDGRAVDLHPVDPTPDGGGDQVLDGGATFHYDAPVEGTVGGTVVRCVSAQNQLAAHSGYEPDDDRADVDALTRRFWLNPPPGY